MNHMPILETDRLYLRPFRLDDAATVQQLAGHPAIAETTINIPHPYVDGMAEAWISTHADRFASDQEMPLAICLKPDGTLIGAISLMGIVRGQESELGYWVGHPYWNRGYCTEAAQAMLRYAFTELGMVRVHARHFTRNPASGRVMQKIGLRHEGAHSQFVKKWDRVEDLELYGLLESEWRKSSISQ